MNLKSTTILHLLLLAASLQAVSLPAAAQQIELHGRVSIFNSKQQNNGVIKYVEEVYITSPYAGTALSDSTGRFSLVFDEIENGLNMNPPLTTSAPTPGTRPLLNN